MTRLRYALRVDEGATAAEYSLIAVAIATVIVAVVFALGQATKGQFSTTCAKLAAASGTTSSDPADCPSS